MALYKKLREGYVMRKEERYEFSNVMRKITSEAEKGRGGCCLSKEANELFTESYILPSLLRGEPIFKGFYLANVNDRGYARWGHMEEGASDFFKKTHNTYIKAKKKKEAISPEERRRKIYKMAVQKVPELRKQLSEADPEVGRLSIIGLFNCYRYPAPGCPKLIDTYYSIEEVYNEFIKVCEREVPGFDLEYDITKDRLEVSWSQSDIEFLL